MSRRYIHHVTLASGHVARQYRSEIGQDAIDALSDTLDGALQGGYMPVPGMDGYFVTASHEGSSLMATLWHGPRDRRAPILTTGTALKSRSGPGLWRLLHDTTGSLILTDPDLPPPTPWQADRLEMGALTHTDAMQWSGDFSRCMAWAWADYVEEKK